MKDYWRCAKVPLRTLHFPIGARGPYHVAVEQPADDHFGGLGADRGEIGARVLRRTCRCKNRLATGDGRHDALLHICRAGYQDQRPGLPVHEPVGRDRGASGQHRLQNHIAFKGRAPMTAIFPWIRRAQNTSLVHFGRKRFVIAGPGSGPQTGRIISQGLG